MSEAKWLTPKAVAGQLDVDRATVIRWCRSGKLTHFTTPGGQYRIAQADLDAFIDASRVRPAS